jgi:phosphoribosylaminoimidazole (AIR) synthetase
MGIGIAIVCSPEQVARIVSILPQAKVIGEIVEGKDDESVIMD